MYTIYIYVIY